MIQFSFIKHVIRNWNKLMVFSHTTGQPLPFLEQKQPILKNLPYQVYIAFLLVKTLAAVTLYT